MNRFLIQQYFLKLFSTLSLSVAFFLAGLVLHYFGQIRDLKISILVLVSFILIFLHKKPCFFQLVCLLCISSIQGVLVSACFVTEKNISETTLIKGILSTLALLISILGATYYSDNIFKQDLGRACDITFYFFLFILLSTRLANFDLQIEFYQKGLFLLMIAMFMMSLRQIYSYEEIKNRNHILDSLVLGFCIMQVLIKMLVVLN